MGVLKLILLFVTFTCLISDQICVGEKILVVAFVSTKSHMLTYRPLLEELAHRGHNVTILSPLKATNTVKNINEIMTLDTEKFKQGFITDPFKNKEKNLNKQPFENIEWFVKVCRETYDLPQVRQLMTESFDLIFLQPMLNECALGLVYRIKAPLVLFSPVSVPNFLANRFGNHFPFSFIPNVFSGMPTEMTFYQRFYNIGFELWIRGFVIYYYTPAIEAVYAEKVGKDVPSIDVMLGNASLILSNGHFSLHNHKPLLPDIVEVGGLHSRPPKPLPQDLEEFIAEGTEGFIYFSMGSAIRGHTMPEEKRMMFLSVFSKLKQQVLWKWETETMPGLPKNVKLSKWLPQQDILGRKDIKMFITHCGGGSTEEAIYHAVPIIALPIFGDQPQNAAFAKRHGLVVELDWNVFTEEQLLQSIEEILNNQKYQENANKLSAIYKDQPEHPLTRAVYWVEYVMRHKGAVHLRSVGRNLNFIEYHSYDVISAYLALLSFVLYLIYKIVSIIFCICIGICKMLAGKKMKEA